MESLFTIGEVAKLFNISVKTLRYYESKNLLNPIYINEKSGYRYYSRNQFLNLDLIKCFRKVGMSIEETKDLIYSHGSINLIQDTVKKQRDKIEEKMNEIIEIKNYLNEINDSILSISNYEVGSIIERYNNERAAITYIADVKNEEERENHFRKVISYIESEYDDINPILGGRVKYDNAIKGDYIYNSLLYFPRGFKMDIFKDNQKELSTNKRKIYKEMIDTKEVRMDMEEGYYLTIVFDDNWSNIDKYYKKILSHISENNIKIMGDFNEVWVMPRINHDGKIVILGYIEILYKI